MFTAHGKVAVLLVGKQVVGFKDVRTGKFTEVMPIRNSRDMDEFREAYDYP